MSGVALPTEADGVAPEIAETHVSGSFCSATARTSSSSRVHLGFLDHRTREPRGARCRRESAVNRRFAPDVYLGVPDVLDEGGAPADTWSRCAGCPRTGGSRRC